MDVVNRVLENSAKEAEKYKTTEVNKYAEVDIGGLIVFDQNNFDLKKLNKSTEDYLLNLTRDNTQLLFNQIWQLPTERVDEVIIAKLPKQLFKLPRFKPCPKPRPLTKWEQFAKEKGIVKKKKNQAKLTWDEQLKKWIPLYGYRKVAATREKDWLLEVPDTANPMEDQFEKKALNKSEKIAKNELQRLRNIAKAKNVKVPRFGLTNPETLSSKQLQAAVTVAKASTASLGKFQEKLPKEKEAKDIAALTPSTTRKRKLPPLSSKNEKQHNLNIIESVLNKRPKINVETAVSNEIQQQTQMNSNKKSKKGSGGGVGASSAGKKPKGGNRQRRGKISGGRKRR